MWSPALRARIWPARRFRRLRRRCRMSPAARVAPADHRRARARVLVSSIGSPATADTRVRPVERAGGVHRGQRRHRGRHPELRAQPGLRLAGIGNVGEGQGSEVRSMRPGSRADRGHADARCGLAARPHWGASSARRDLRCSRRSTSRLLRGLLVPGPPTVGEAAERAGSYSPDVSSHAQSADRSRIVATPDSSPTSTAHMTPLPHERRAPGADDRARRPALRAVRDDPDPPRALWALLEGSAGASDDRARGIGRVPAEPARRPHPGPARVCDGGPAAGRPTR